MRNQCAHNNSDAVELSGWGAFDRLTLHVARVNAQAGVKRA